eukprot:1281617-Prymnesium_polylepis.1
MLSGAALSYTAARCVTDVKPTPAVAARTLATKVSATAYSGSNRTTSGHSTITTRRSEREASPEQPLVTDKKTKR